MGRSYEQLSLEERCDIARLQAEGRSIRQIAAALDRSPSSVSRELKRNTGAGPRASPYKPIFAQAQTRARRWSGSKLDRDEALRERVIGKLKQGCSPEQVCGRLQLEEGHRIIGCETVYRFIYAQMKRTNNGAWRRYLPQAKARRGRRGAKGGSPLTLIQQRVPLDQRPAEADRRDEPGHWEADYMLFSTYGQSALVLHERASRFTFLRRTPNRRAKPTAKALGRWIKPLPKRLKRSMTFDNGTEFAEHHTLGLDTYFCDVRAPWQKGGVENAIGRLRRHLPRKTDLDSLTDSQIQRVVLAYNHTPRRCLGFQTPAEVFLKLLHFEWESTSRHSPG